jgi:hypothetical protein
MATQCFDFSQVKHFPWKYYNGTLKEIQHQSFIISIQERMHVIVQSYFTFKVLHLNKDTRFKGEENSFAD